MSSGSRRSWEDIEAKVAKGNAPTLLYGEPDLTLKVVRDLFTEDFGRLIIEGDDAWDTVQGYVAHVAPDLEERLERLPGRRGRRLLGVPNRRADPQGRWTARCGCRRVAPWSSIAPRR
ncbi:MAG: ribonuclease E/G [Nocardioides sp.]